MSRKETSQTEAAADEMLIREAEDDSAWEPPIHVSAKPWARRAPVRHSRGEVKDPKGQRHGG